MDSPYVAHADRRALRSLAFAMMAALLLAACQQSPGGATVGDGQNTLTTEPPTRAACAAVLVDADRVYFEYDSANLRPDALQKLDALAAHLQLQPQCRFMIEGHCDDRGTREYNLALGDKRASVVMTYLAARGVDPTRLDTVSYGKERPAVVGSTEEAWAQNRRAVMVQE